MIDPKEVRIGNWVIKVTGTDAQNAVYLEYRAVALEEYFITWAKVCFPIRLTPDILNICAFTQEQNAWKLPINAPAQQAHTLFLHWRAEKDWYLNGLKLPFAPVYVHQLQNLYYALTGKELVVNLLPYQNTDLIQPIRFNRALIKNKPAGDLL
jgi:hypothetical protein